MTLLAQDATFMLNTCSTVTLHLLSRDMHHPLYELVVPCVGWTLFPECCVSFMEVTHGAER